MARSLLEEPTISKRLLFPRTKHFDSPYWLQSGDNKLSCYRLNNHPSSKTLIVFHASGEVVSDYFKVFAPEIDRLGYNIFVVEHRGYSLSEGYATLINIIDDIKSVISASKTPHEKIVVYGRALGSLYAVYTASKFKKIKGLIIDNGIADFYEQLNKRVSAEDIDTTEKKVQAEIKKYFNIEKMIKDYKGHTLILHSLKDRVISVDHAKQIYSWASEPKMLKLFEDGEHNSLSETNRSSYFKTVKMFMDNIR